MDPVIKVENLSKSFIISHEGQEKYTALRDVISKKAKRLFSFPAKLNSNHTAKSTEEFWALKNVTFNVEQGDRVGIIGRNGAGKSTLLKILSRITEPTKGEIRIKGRVASLLEVGTGFHPELTGRENIFLNGAILGMTRMEIRQKFDQIVEFAEVEKFLDTPVKRYSSGMYVRLAFSVAAHLEPEILVVDEVLAVGDAQFQKKCLGKMQDVSNNEGRTVLFVSHNLSSLISLCSKSIVLQNGELLLNSSIEEGIRLYQSLAVPTEQNDKKIFRREKLDEKKKVQISSMEFNESEESLDFGFSLKIKIISTYNTRIAVNVFLKDGLNMPIAIGIYENNTHLIPVKEGENIINMHTDSILLAHGLYKLSVELVIPGYERLDRVEDVITFELSNEQLSKRRYRIDQGWGYGSFEIKFLQNSVT